MHHLRSALLLFLIVCLYLTPALALAQTSPFMTGATSLQTNARVAREFLVALPAELPAERQLILARGFSHELSDRYGFALDLAVHEPRNFPGSDPRNFHAHLLATTREVGIEELGAKTTLEWNDGRRREAGLGPAINELLHMRQRWEKVANEALQEAQLSSKIDHRSLAQQGIDREPRPHIPKAVFEMERQGFRTIVGERLREDYRQRVEARLSKSAENQPQPPKNVEEIRREARESWLRMRADAERSKADIKRSAALDDDRSL